MAAFNLSPAEFALAGYRIHYAWVIVLITAIMRLVSSSFRMSFPALVPIIAEVFGWSQGLILFAFSLQWVVSGMFGPLSGWLGDRYGARFTLTLGASLYIVSMILAGFMTELWHLYLFFGVMLSASMGIFQVPLTVSVTSWFRRHLGLGMGLLQSSQGVGPVIVPAIMVGLVAYFSLGQGQQWAEAFPFFKADSIGIRMAFWIAGIVGGIILLLLTRLFHNSPEDVGMRQLGADPNESLRAPPTTGRVAKERARVFLRQASKTSTFWNLVGIHYWGCAGHAIIIMFLQVMVVDLLRPEGGYQGVDKALVGASAVGITIAGTMHLTSTITRFAAPIAADLFGSKWVMAACFTLQFVPVLILLFANELWIFYLFAVLFGIGFGGEMSAFPIINRQYYGRAPIGSAYGFQMMGAGAGMASGALLGSGLYIGVTELGFPVIFNNPYCWTILLSFVMSLGGVIAILLLPTTHRHQLPDWEDELPAEFRTDAPAPADPASTAAPATGGPAPAPAGAGDGS